MSDQYESVVLLETDDVRVIEERVPVGGAIPAHTHTAPFLLVALSGDRAQALDSSGKALNDIDYKALSPGYLGYLGPEDVPDTHALKNTGNEPIVFLQIDLLSVSRRDGS